MSNYRRSCPLCGRSIFFQSGVDTREGCLGSMRIEHYPLDCRVPAPGHGRVIATAYHQSIANDIAHRALRDPWLASVYPDGFGVRIYCEGGERLFWMGENKGDRP